MSDSAMAVRQSTLSAVPSVTSLENKPNRSRANTFLKIAATFWLIVTIIGQWAFMGFVAVFYGSSSLQGHFADWTKNKMLLKGYVAGDTAGNLFFAAHVLIAAVIAFGGVLQLIPQIRARATAFHRWNGRVFMVAVLAASLSGLYLVWVRQTSLTTTGALAISLDAILIIVFAVLAWRAALAHDFIAHRRWALRTFIVASGVWFQRLGYLAWFIINRGPVGVTDKMDGAFDLFWAFGCYLVPLVVLEFYLRAKEDCSTAKQYISGITLVAGILIMLVGVVGTTALMWWPLLAKS